MLKKQFQMSGQYFVILLFCALFANLATSAVTTQGRFSGMDRMNEPEIASCLRAKVCAVTLELTPTCGSDGRTYPNGGTIECLNECLKPEEHVTIASRGFCKDDAPQKS